MAPYPGYKPVRENFLTKIVEVGWPGERFFFSVFWRADFWRRDVTLPGSACSPAVEFLLPTPVFSSVSGIWGFEDVTFNNPYGPKFQIPGEPTFPDGGMSDSYFAVPDYLPPDFQTIVTQGPVLSFNILGVKMSSRLCRGSAVPPNFELSTNGLFGYQPILPGGRNVVSGGEIFYDGTTATYNDTPLRYEGTSIGVFQGPFVEGSATHFATVSVRFSGPPNILDEEPEEPEEP